MNFYPRVLNHPANLTKLRQCLSVLLLDNHSIRVAFGRVPVGQFQYAPHGARADRAQFHHGQTTANFSELWKRDLQATGTPTPGVLFYIHSGK